MRTQSQIWNIPIRLVHWTLAALVVANQFFTDESDSVHRYVGYGAFAIVVFRIAYGFLTSSAARLNLFPLSRRSLFTFLNNEIKRTPLDYPGHNPAAAWTYILIWSSIALLGLSGWMLSLDAFWGNEIIESAHSILADFLLVLVCLHLLGLGWDSFKFRRRTWLGMITGKRT